jgi:TonB family protein
MRSIGGAAFIAAAAIALSACASGPETRTSHLVSASAYNDAMAAQGMSYYCGGGKCDVPPSLVSARAPVYPAAALSAGREGIASVIFYIDANGDPSDLRLESATYPDFGEAALGAIADWKYTPATLAGQPVRIGPVRQQIPFSAKR